MQPVNKSDALRRIRNGDREAAAQFLMEHSDLIRRRIRVRLSPRLRAVFGSDDVISTVGRPTSGRSAR